MSLVDFRVTDNQENGIPPANSLSQNSEADTEFSASEKKNHYIISKTFSILTRVSYVEFVRIPDENLAPNELLYEVHDEGCGAVSKKEALNSVTAIVTTINQICNNKSGNLQDVSTEDKTAFIIMLPVSAKDMPMLDMKTFVERAKHNLEVETGLKHSLLKHANGHPWVQKVLGLAHISEEEGMSYCPVPEARCGARNWVESAKADRSKSVGAGASPVHP